MTKLKAYQDRSCFGITEALPLIEIQIHAEGSHTKRSNFGGSPLISGFVNVGHARSNQKDRVYPIYLRDQKIYIPEDDLYDGGFVENDKKETSTRENSLNLHLCVNKCVKCVLHKGGGYSKTKQKPVPIPKEFFRTIIVDEITRTFRGVTCKALIGMEGLSGFMVAISYKNVMDSLKDAIDDR